MEKALGLLRNFRKDTVSLPGEKSPEGHLDTKWIQKMRQIFLSH